MVKNKRTENNIFRRFALKGERDDDDGFHDFSFLSLVKTTLLATTLTLYVLNQQHLLPYNLSKIVSKVLFWPTLPITIFRRLGKWETVIDDTVSKSQLSNIIFITYLVILIDRGHYDMIISKLGQF